MSHLVELLRTPTGGKPPNKWELQAADRIEAGLIDSDAVDPLDDAVSIAVAALAPRTPT